MSSMASIRRRPRFSARRFLEDLKKGSEAIDAPYSEETTKAVLEVYGQNFRDGAIQLRATGRPGDPLMYRVYTRKPINASDSAVERGFLDPNNAMIPLVGSWRSLWDDAREQLDFAADKGVTGVFLFLGAPRNVNLLLDVPLAPESMKSNKSVFSDLGLELVEAVGINYHTRKIDFYFIAKGPLTEDLAAKLCALAGASPPSKELYDDMSILLGTDPFFFMVMMDFETGKISEVEFYLIFPIELPGGRLPEVGPRLTAYWDVDCYDEEVMDMLGWCFCDDGHDYLRADRGYCGGLRNILRDWKIMSVE